MGLNDILYLKAEIIRENISETLAVLTSCVRDYVHVPLPPQCSLDDFFKVFPEGDRTLQGNYFFVQARVKPLAGRGTNGGRMGVGYSFANPLEKKGILQISIFDNGENVPEDVMKEVYDVLKRYIVDNKMAIVEEGKKKEF